MHLICACEMQSSNRDFWATVTEDDGIPKEEDMPPGIIATFVAHVTMPFAFPGKGEYAEDKQVCGRAYVR